MIQQPITSPSTLSIELNFNQIGSPPVRPVTDGGGKTEWMPCRIALDHVVMFSSDKLFVMAMKSSTYTSRFVICCWLVTVFVSSFGRR